MAWLYLHILLTIFIIGAAVIIAVKLYKSKELVYKEFKNKDVLVALGYFLAREEALAEEHLRQLRRTLYNLEQSGVDVSRYRSMARKKYKLDIEGKNYGK